jgi:hypothetical protein
MKRLSKNETPSHTAYVEFHNKRIDTINELVEIKVKRRAQLGFSANAVRHDCTLEVLLMPACSEQAVWDAAWQACADNMNHNQSKFKTLNNNG